MLYSPKLAKALACWLLLTLAYTYPVHAQNPSIQDCLGAIPVCQKIYEETNAPIGNGNMFDFVSEDNCTVGESGSIWYTFTVNKSGKFGFLLTPNNPIQDYDWVLFDITTANCEDIQKDPSLVVSCNAAGKGGCEGPTGATGATNFNDQGPNCGNTPPTQSAGFSPFNDLIDVVEGNTYTLCILNFTANLSEGYVLDFGLSTDIGIFDEVPPSLAEVSYPGSCDGQHIDVEFSEFIQCATISEANFQLTGTGGPYTIGLSAVNCAAGGSYSRSFNLLVNPPLPFGGDLELELIVDGTTEALDLCGNPSIPGNLTFGGPTLTDLLDLGPDTTLCEGNTLELRTPFSGSYFWSDGSNGAKLEVTETGTYWLTINTPCGPTSDTINVFVGGASGGNGVLGPDTTICQNGTIFLDATTAASTYLWQDGSTLPTLSVDQPGTYSVDITNVCGTLNEDIIIELTDPITASLQDTAICVGGAVLFDVTTPGATYLWQDGSTEPTFSATTAGDYTVSISTACESLNLSAGVDEKTGQAINVDLGADTTLCTGQTLLLEVNAPNSGLEWQDGSTGSSFLVSQAGTYQLKATNECSTVEDEINVDFADLINASINDADLCPGDSVIFDLTTAGASYLWQDASTSPRYTAITPGMYSVVITNACEEIELSAEVTLSTDPIPAINLGNDTSLCMGQSLALSLEIPGVSYVWQDGTETESYEVTSTGTYSVTVSNSCESQTGSIQIDFPEPILIDLPQDTFLCPGENLMLDVTNENATSYIWQDNTTEPIYKVNEPGSYMVLLANECEEVSVMINIDRCESCRVYIPNAFSPNGDGKNDSFQPYFDCIIEELNLKVFNRWGILLFETSSTDYGWDGTFNGQTAEEGVYIYVLKLNALENGKMKEASFSGDVTITK